MKYGEQSTTTIAGGVITERVEKLVAGDTVKSFIRQTETIKVDNNQEVLGEFLKLLDRQKAGEIHSLGFECIPSKFDERAIHRVRMSWICVSA